MKLSKIVDISGPVKRRIPIAAESDFITDLTAAFVEWEAPNGAFLDGLCHIACITKIGETSAGDAATLRRISDNRENSYWTVKPPAADHERVRRTTRGGMAFMPSALANFAEQALFDAARRTDAASRGKRMRISGRRFQCA